MSRVPRIQIDNAVYYVTPTSDYGKPVFKDGEDYTFYMALLAQYKNKHNFKLFAFCLAPNSIGLLIEPSSKATISQIMHDLNPNYTKYFNKRHNREGRLFQERYRIVLVEKATNLLKMTAYIHLRPKILHLTDDISKYKYTSFSAYLNEGHGNPDMADEVAYVLGCLKDKSYKQFVYEMGDDEAKELSKALEKEKVIGSEDFRHEVELKIKEERQTPEAASQTVPIEKQDVNPQPVPIEKPPVLPTPAPIREMPAVNSRSASNMWIFTVSVCLVILSIILSTFFAYISITRMEERMKQEIANKDAEIERLSNPASNK